MRCPYCESRRIATRNAIHACLRCLAVFKASEVVRQRVYQPKVKKVAPRIAKYHGEKAGGWYRPEFQPLRRDLYALRDLAMRVR